MPSISLLLIGIAIGVTLVSFKPLQELYAKFISKPNSKISTLDIDKKRQSLEEFYTKIVTADDNKDWASMYSLERQSIKNNFTLEEYTGIMKKQQNTSKTFSRTRTVNNITVDGDIGKVDRTVVTCLTKDCSGKDRQEENAIIQYEYVNGKWQVPDPKPSDKALSAATYLYINGGSAGQKTLISEWGYGSKNPTFAISNLALYFDENQDQLTLAETFIDKDKVERARPVVNYQESAPNYQPPTIIQQPNNHINCTTNTIGSYAYTNCY